MSHSGHSCVGKAGGTVNKQTSSQRASPNVQVQLGTACGNRLSGRLDTPSHGKALEYSWKCYLTNLTKKVVSLLFLRSISHFYLVCYTESSNSLICSSLMLGRFSINRYFDYIIWIKLLLKSQQLKGSKFNIKSATKFDIFYIFFIL